MSGLGLSTLYGSPAFAGDGVPVTSITTTYSAATPTGPFTNAGFTVRYGQGDNVTLNSATITGGFTVTRSAVSKPNITIKRKDNANVTGERLTFFYPAIVTGSNIYIQGNQAPSMEVAMNDDYLTSGGLDVFLNVDNGVEKANNIERVDFVIPSGMKLPTTAALLSQIGTIGNEKHGNNTYKIAMITSLSAFGEPASYGPLKTIQGNVDYGNLGRPQTSGGTDLRNAYVRNNATPSPPSGNGDMYYIRSDTNFIGMSFVSFAALGASAGQTVYGYSLFPGDVNSGHDLVTLSNVPLTTSGGANGGDIYGGTYAIFTTPAAEAETEEGAPDIVASKTVTMHGSGGSGTYAIPGEDVVYTISVANNGTGSPDTDSVFIVDTLPNDVAFFNGDMNGGDPGTDPVIFEDAASGLNFTYGSDIGYAGAGSPPTEMSNCGLGPAPGYDPNVRYICINPKGTLAHGAGNPGFDVKFRTRIE